MRASDRKLVRHPRRGPSAQPRTVRDIHDRHDHLLQPQIKHVTLTQLGLEIRTSRQDQPCHVWPVVRDEMLHGNLRHLPHVVMPLLHPQPRKTQGRLPSPPVLLGQIDRKLVQHLSVVPAQRPVQRPMPVHHNEPVPLIRLHQLTESLGVELVIAQVERCIDWFERLKVDVHLLFLALVRDDRPRVDDQAIRWDLGVQLQTLLGRRDCSQHRLTVHARLDVRRRAVLGLEHGLCLGDLRFWG